MPFKMHKIIFFSMKKKKNVCLPYLKFAYPLPETHLFFIWPYGKTVQLFFRLKMFLGWLLWVSAAVPAVLSLDTSIDFMAGK